MAGHARFTAVLDACVLYPVGVADALISLAVAGLYAAKWTVAIEDEWVRNLERNRPELQGRLGPRRDDMRAAVQMAAGCAELEASGNVSLNTIAAIAATAACGGNKLRSGRSDSVNWRGSAPRGASTSDHSPPASRRPGIAAPPGAFVH